MKGKKVIVTGGAGFIGAHLVRELIARGAEVHVVDTFVAGRFEERLSPSAVYHEVDILETEKLGPIFNGASYVFHLAALPRVQDSIDHPIETARVNVDGTLAVLEAARAAKAEKVVFSSSAAVYGDHAEMPLRETLDARPKSPYGLHKYMGERMCALWSELYQLPTVSLRYFNVYGPGFDPKGAYALVVGRFLDLRAQGKPLPIAGDGTNTRDYVHVKDVVRANLLAAESDAVGKGEVFNIGGGVETSVRDLAALIGGPTETAPARIEPARSVADISLARESLGWEPSIALAVGINDLKKRNGT